MEYQIGEFSYIARLTVKTIRFYHEEGLLLPARIDGFTGYRYYNAASIEQARLITTLRSFDFTIEEIKHILIEYTEDEDLALVLHHKAETIQASMTVLRNKEKRISQVLKHIEEQKTMNINQDVIVKDFPEELIVSIRFKGKYEEIGMFFGKLFKSAGSKMAGKPFALYHDNEYREENADIEAGLPVRTTVNSPGIECKNIPACQCLVIVHRGPYDTLSSSYEKLSTKAAEMGLKSSGPIREIYLKGPGMIFRGNPRNYLTEIRLPISR